LFIEYVSSNLVPFLNSCRTYLLRISIRMGAFCNTPAHNSIRTNPTGPPQKYTALPQLLD
jgi:hypothetical protein